MATKPRPAATAASAEFERLAAEVREALNTYAATVPHPELAELGYAVRVRAARRGRIYKARLALLIEARQLEADWQTLEGVALSGRELAAAAAVDEPAQATACETCEGSGWVECAQCAGGPVTAPCAKCGGKGDMRCRNCHGVGTTAHRSGKWTVRRKCMKCLGTGHHACDACHGSKTGCPGCAGKGRVRCPACGRAEGARETAGSAELPPLDPAKLGVDVWFDDRPMAPGFEPLSDHWRLELPDEPRPCPVCDGEGRRACATCHGSGHSTCTACGGEGIATCPKCRGNGCAACGHEGSLTCPACHGRPSRPCAACAGKRSADCRACAGRGELRAKLGVRRALEPWAGARYIGEIPCPQAVLEADGPDDEFRSEGHATVDGPPDPAFWPPLPEPVATALVELGHGAMRGGDPTRRIVRHHIEVASIDATHALYTHEGNEYDCWLLGSARRLLAPSNPVTQRLEADLAAIRERSESGDPAGALALLEQCRAIGAADPDVRRRLDEVEAALLGEAGGEGWPAWVWAAGVGALVVLAALGVWMGAG